MSATLSIPPQSSYINDVWLWSSIITACKIILTQLWCLFLSTWSTTSAPAIETLVGRDNISLEHKSRQYFRLHGLIAGVSGSCIPYPGEPSYTGSVGLLPLREEPVLAFSSLFQTKRVRKLRYGYYSLVLVTKNFPQWPFYAKTAVLCKNKGNSSIVN